MWKTIQKPANNIPKVGNNKTMKEQMNWKLNMSAIHETSRRRNRHIRQIAI